MSKRISLALVLAAAGPALAGQSAPPPAELTTVTVEGEQLTLGPFITENYLGGEGGKSDPVNLIFLNTDPRAIRQQLMKLDGSRSSEWSFLPNGAKGCVWMDGMGYEQAAYLEPEGWVGGVVQLVCTTKDSPLGNWYRFHVRLFRSGPHTIGGAHFELNTPGTAQHEVLSWEMARDFVRDEMARLDADDKGETQLFDPGTPGTFRTTNGLVYYFYVWGPNVSTNQPFLTALGLGPPSLGPTPIPATGFATVYAPDFTYVPARSDITLTDSRIYNVPGTPKPFCGGENIQITGGPLTLTLRVQTNPSGKYQRTYTVAGKLTIKTLATGAVQEAIISEAHRGMLTDNYEEVTQEISQVLLPIDTAPGQSLHVIFGAGQTDYWVPQQNCAIE
jgi:hypothetical protein